MHIELTDHLRCPQDHPEAFLVLLPDRMESRTVVAGHLGCPVCGWSTAWTDGVPDFGDGERSTVTLPFDAAAAVAMLGVDGPGGWIALGGSAGMIADDLAKLVPGVAFVAINPPESVTPSDAISVIVSGTWPIKTHALRGVVLGSDVDEWRAAAVRSTLPGLRSVGVGAFPMIDDVDVLAEADGVWVVRHR